MLVAPSPAHLGGFVRRIRKSAASQCLVCATELRRSFHPTTVPEFKGTSRMGFTVENLDKRRDNRERVVILGSGWAGYNLARQLDPKKFQAVIVSPRSYFVFTPLLASTSVGTLEFRTALEPIRSKKSKAVFFQGWAEDIDLQNKTLTIEENVDDPGQSLAPTGGRDHLESKEEREMKRITKQKQGQLFDLKYDKLVIAVGCYSQTFGTPGVRENALFLKDVGDARKIRNRLLSCFENASLPTTSNAMRKILLNFAVVGGGPTGIEFSAELHDLISDDLSKLYPDLMKYVQITVYDVAPQVLSMFDENLGKYAMNAFKREGIAIKTSHHVEELRAGPPQYINAAGGVHDEHSVYTLKMKELGEIGVGMCVWSTGLMMNPFVQRALGKPQTLAIPHKKSVDYADAGENASSWLVQKHPKTGALVTNDKMQLLLSVPPTTSSSSDAATDASTLTLQDTFALGDCATQAHASYPATAQVANQEAMWLAIRLNRGDLATQHFTYKNLGVMAYIGNWKAIVQTKGGNISGQTAWFIWRGAYLTKSVSWRNKILIPIYWLVNWVFGRDVSRF